MLSPGSSEKLNLYDIYLNCSDRKFQHFFDIKLILCDWEEDMQNSIIIIINDVSEKVRMERYRQLNNYKTKMLETLTD